MHYIIEKVTSKLRKSNYGTYAYRDIQRKIYGEKYNTIEDAMSFLYKKGFFLDGYIIKREKNIWKKEQAILHPCNIYNR